MLDDLLEKHDLYSMSKSEIMELLGDDDNNEKENNEKVFYYIEESYHDPVLLVITYSEDGRVLKYEKVKS